MPLIHFTSCYHLCNVGCAVQCLLSVFITNLCNCFILLFVFALCINLVIDDLYLSNEIHDATEFLTLAVVTVYGVV